MLYLIGGFFAVCGFALALLVARFWFVPWNKAKLLRDITRKNYVVALIRKPGGQISNHVVAFNGPTLSVNNKSYEPDERTVNYFGSVPVFVFPENDVKPLNLSTSEIKDYYRDPAHLEAVQMLLKALYEKLALQDKQTIMLLLGVTLAVVVLLGLGEYIIYQQLETIGQSCANNTGGIIINAGGA